MLCIVHYIYINEHVTFITSKGFPHLYLLAKLVSPEVVTKTRDGTGLGRDVPSRPGD